MQNKKNNRQQIISGLLVSIFILSIFGNIACRSSSVNVQSTNVQSTSGDLSPRQTVEQSVRLTEQGNFEEFKKLLSANYKAKAYAPNSFLEKTFPGVSGMMKGLGGVKSIEIVKEDISGDKAKVISNYHYGNGKTVDNITENLVKEDGKWKIDGDNETLK